MPRPGDMVFAGSVDVMMQWPPDGDRDIGAGLSWDTLPAEPHVAFLVLTVVTKFPRYEDLTVIYEGRCWWIRRRKDAPDGIGTMPSTSW